MSVSAEAIEIRTAVMNQRLLTEEFLATEEGAEWGARKHVFEATRTNADLVAVVTNSVIQWDNADPYYWRHEFGNSVSTHRYPLDEWRRLINECPEQMAAQRMGYVGDRRDAWVYHAVGYIGLGRKLFIAQENGSLVV